MVSNKIKRKPETNLIAFAVDQYRVVFSIKNIWQHFNVFELYGKAVSWHSKNVLIKFQKSFDVLKKIRFLFFDALELWDIHEKESFKLQNFEAL